MRTAKQSRGMTQEQPGQEVELFLALPQQWQNNGEDWRNNGNYNVFLDRPDPRLFPRRNRGLSGLRCADDGRERKMERLTKLTRAEAEKAMEVSVDG